VHRYSGGDPSRPPRSKVVLAVVAALVVAFLAVIVWSTIWLITTYNRFVETS